MNHQIDKMEISNKPIVFKTVLRIKSDDLVKAIKKLITRRKKKDEKFSQNDFFIEALSEKIARELEKEDKILVKQN